MRKNDEGTSQEVNSRESPQMQAKSSPLALLMGAQAPTQPTSALNQIEELIANDDLSSKAKIKQLEPLVKELMNSERSAQVIMHIADEIDAQQALERQTFFFNSSKKAYKPIFELLLDRFMVLFLENIEERIHQRNIDISSDEGIVVFNGALGVALESDGSKDLHKLLKLADKTSGEFYTTHRKELSFEIAQRFEDIQREVYEYELEKNGAMNEFTMSGGTFRVR